MSIVMKYADHKFGVTFMLEWSKMQFLETTTSKNVADGPDVAVTGEDCHIDIQPAWITSMAWPQLTSQDEPEHLLVGTINGSVNMLTVFPRNKQHEELVNCSQQYGECTVSY
jgi:hypothetical protein